MCSCSRCQLKIHCICFLRTNPQSYSTILSIPIGGSDHALISVFADIYICTAWTKGSSSNFLLQLCNWDDLRELFSCYPWSTHIGIETIIANSIHQSTKQNCKSRLLTNCDDYRLIWINKGIVSCTHSLNPILNSTII